MIESKGQTDLMTKDESETASNGTRLTRRAPPPAGLAPLRLAFGALGRVLPGFMSIFAYRLWFKTRRFPLRDNEREVLGRATCETIKVGKLPVAVYGWGRGPTVLLIHGWHGSAANFAAFVDPLVDAGFRALTFDAPAHGATPGNQTTIYEIAAAIDAIVDKHGPIDAVITHSFGAPCVLMAIDKGMSVRRAVCISPPAEVTGLLEAFVETLNLPEGVVDRFRGRLEREFGEDIWQRLSPAKLVQGLDLPALIIHDRYDRAMLYEEGETLARIWPKAVFHGTRGLGHNRILIDPDVISRVIAFLKE
jgi:pimeloyl-ACP methyl ester carboxylesterase